MVINQEQKTEIIKHFIEARIYQGEDDMVIGHECSIMMEAMERSSIGSRSEEGVARLNANGNIDDINCFRHNN